MSKRREFETMIAERIELASSKTSVALSAAGRESNVVRRQQLEDCGLAIAQALGQLAELRAATEKTLPIAQRDMDHAWKRMEAAVRQVTGEPAVMLVAMPRVPTRGVREAN